MTRAHKLQVLVAAGLAPSERFLQKRLRAGLIRGIKVGREWRMTDEHIDEYVASMENQARPRIHRETPTGGLSVASMRRRAS